jgi:hypothetical protein
MSVFAADRVIDTIEKSQSILIASSNFDSGRHSDKKSARTVEKKPFLKKGR